MSDSPPPATPGVIVCPVAPWYYRRMGLLSLVLVAAGLYFLYDGKWGYPRANRAAVAKDWFESEVLADYDAAVAKGPDAAKAWVAEARAKGWINKPELEQPRWSDFAAKYGWAENPKLYSDAEIREQFYWGGGMILCAAIVGVVVLLNHNKRLVGHEDHLVLPNGSKVWFREVFKVDKRKWDLKGLAYAWHRPEGSGGPGHRATIDDLKYDGAGKVLDRLLTQFKGELIEKIVEPEPAAAGESDAPHKETPPSPAT